MYPRGSTELRFTNPWRIPNPESRIPWLAGEHAELETQAILGQRLGYIDKHDMTAFEALSTSTGQLTHGLLRSLDKGS